MLIRTEKPSDYSDILKIYSNVFNHGTESEMLDKLRKSDTYIPELAFVAEFNANIVGHILFVRVLVAEQVFIALAPSAIIPGSKRLEILDKLIIYGIEAAKSLGYNAIFAIGDPSDYEKYGFELASKYDIETPWDFLPKTSFLVRILEDNALNGISGKVIYGDIF